MGKPQDLGELRSSEYSEERLKGRSVRDEIRANLILKRRDRCPLKVEQKKIQAVPG